MTTLSHTGLFNYTPRCKINSGNREELNSKYMKKCPDWILNLSAYCLVPWCTNPRNETLVHQNAWESGAKWENNKQFVCSPHFQWLGFDHQNWAALFLLVNSCLAPPLNPAVSHSATCSTNFLWASWGAVMLIHTYIIILRTHIHSTTVSCSHVFGVAIS